jgi:hypothetical protein|tara:strand:+ start:1185 stop:1715 length:531 start_codon:yes stop_codon:yes gene_type:complete
MSRNSHTTPSLITNISINGNRYQGPLQHLEGKKDFKLFTWCKDPEFLFATASIIGRGALVVFRCITHRSSIQANTDYQFLPYQNPIVGQPEWIVLSNVMVGRYGVDRYEKYRTLKVLKALELIELHPDLAPGRCPVIKFAQGIMEYEDILNDEDMRTALKYKSDKLKKQFNVSETK